MSDLVGNPEDRFSRVTAHIKVGFKGVYFSCTCFLDDSLLIEKTEVWVEVRGKAYCIQVLFTQISVE